MELTPELEQTLAACVRSTKTAGKVFFPDRFYRPFDPLHDQIFNIIDNSSSQLLALAAPRGIGKTSINNLLLPAKHALFRLTDYIVPVSASATLAEQQAENLKYELLNNPTITELFGNLKTNNFNKQQWVVNVGGKEICIMPRGAGQQIRGLLFRNSRPGLIVVDDLEDPNNMDSEDQRRKKKEWFYGDLMGSVDKARDDWRIIVLGTILHQDSLLINLLDSPHWESVQLSIADREHLEATGEFKSNAPNVMTDKQIRELHSVYVDDGMEDTFFREYMNMPISSRSAVFQRDFFRYYEEGELALDLPPFENGVIVDPAKTTKLQSAESGIIGFAFNPRTQAVYIREAIGAKLHPDELMHEVFAMLDRINARVLGVEVTSLHEFITFPIKNEMGRRGKHYELVELQARAGQNEKGKAQRVKSLAPLYRQGLVYHNKANCKALEQQLLSFPKAKRWDLMDAAGYIVEILEKGQRYMEPWEELDMDPRRAVEREFLDLDGDGMEAPLNEFRMI